MRKNPQRTAWVVLLTSFTIFVLLMISIPVGIRWYLFNAEVSQTTQLTAIQGTMLARQLGEADPSPVTQGGVKDLTPIDIISSDDRAQGILTFFEGSEITLYNDTLVILHQAKMPRYTLSPNPDEIVVEIVKGRIRANVTNGAANSIFTVRSRHGVASLNPGSYAIDVQRDQTQVTTRQGLAQVTAQGQTVIVNESELTTITADQPPSDTYPAEQNLIVNGEFSPPITDQWQTSIFAPTDTVTGTLRLNNNRGRTALEFASRGENNIHTEVSIRQEINKDVRDYQSLRINAEILLNYQSLPGGGQLGTEFPIMIELGYEDSDGNDQKWFHGFYYEPPPPNFILYSEPGNNSEMLTQQVWYAYESPNLLLNPRNAKPIFIKYIRIYASGWIFNANVADVQLLAQD